MKKLAIFLAGVAALSLAAPAAAEKHLVAGTVTKVDAAAQKMTIRHGPMPKFEMNEGMTMVFRVQKPEMLSQVKPGDSIRFDADKINGAFTVIELQKVN